MSLQDELIARIHSNGPISIADYMAECLFHPTYGYYTTHEPFGTAGDFITAPEISQMFGELIGLALAQAWIDQGSPTSFTLAELGPGRGTLMVDALRATAQVPGFHDAAQIVLVEASARLQEIQAHSLSGYNVSFTADAETLPDAPLYFVANEFFDALPVRQFVRTRTQWRERLVGLSDSGLSFGLGPEGRQPSLDHRLDDTQEGDIVETSPQMAPICATLTSRIARFGGIGLAIDYGDWRSLGDTLQAMEKHSFADVLSSAGWADLTAHVDFETLAASAVCAHSRLTTQGMFLERLGITDRARALAHNLTGEALDRHIAAHRRLTHPEEMGNLFKALGFFPKGMAPPPGLDV